MASKPQTRITIVAHVEYITQKLTLVGPSKPSTPPGHNTTCGHGVWAELENSFHNARQNYFSRQGVLSDSTVWHLNKISASHSDLIFVKTRPHSRSIKEQHHCETHTTSILSPHVEHNPRRTRHHGHATQTPWAPDSQVSVYSRRRWGSAGCLHGATSPAH